VATREHHASSTNGTHEHHRHQCHQHQAWVSWAGESPSLVLVINDTKLLMPCVKYFKFGISNTCDEGVCGKKWWPQDHKEMVHGHEMMIMVIKLKEMDMEQVIKAKVYS
jgi:hypothetical protein